MFPLLSTELPRKKGMQKMTEKRPVLHSGLAADVFLDWYWLKSELTDFCRQEKLSTKGGKPEITERIAVFLCSGNKLRPEVERKPAKDMPAGFSLQSVIGPGWRCTEDLRNFLKIHLGANFRFNSVMRDYVLHRLGATLEEAVAAYKADKADHKESDISAQFEYNRFIRSYMQANPAANRQDVIKAWHAHRNTPKSSRTII